MSSSLDRPHRRFNPLKGEWVIVAPQRGRRPWAGQREAPSAAAVPAFDPANPLCPGVARPNGATNPAYTSTFVFTNDFPALLPDHHDPAGPGEEEEELLRTSPAGGTCKVMCFHPRSDLQLATMSHAERMAVIRAWRQLYEDLAPTYQWVQIFENKGAIMGCSNPHPHCQVWATHFLPNEPALKDARQREYLERKGRPMLLDYLALEVGRKERLVVETEHWVGLVPFWAVWPYETLLLPRAHRQRLSDLSAAEEEDLAEAMRLLLTKYDNLFRTSFPYSMGWHGAPGQGDAAHWQLHALYLPPLFRSATVKKFMAGFELLAEPQRDLTAEDAAKSLRQQSNTHYTQEAKQDEKYSLYRWTRLGAWLTRRSIAQARRRLGPSGHCDAVLLDLPGLSVVAVGNNEDNLSYLLHSAGQTAAVDLGDWAPVREELGRRGWALHLVLSTHAHWDHCLGNAEARAAFPRARFVGSRRDGPAETDAFVGEGERLGLGEAAVEVLETPGHTHGHLAYLVRGDGALGRPALLLTGDWLFVAGAGQIFEGSVAQMRGSLERLRALPEDTLLLPGHDYARQNLRFVRHLLSHDSLVAGRLAAAEAGREKRRPLVAVSLADELATNPFLRLADPDLLRALRLDPHAHPDTVLLNLRKQKNAFTA